MLDEPAAGLNPQEKRDLQSLIDQLRREFGVAVLLIEHDMSLIMGNIRPHPCHGTRQAHHDRHPR